MTENIEPIRAADARRFEARLAADDRSPFMVATLVAAFVALAILKPWAAGSPEAQRSVANDPNQVAQAAPGEPGRSALAARTPTDDAISEMCLEPGSWRTATVETWNERTVRVWRAIDPAPASRPLDPSIPIVPAVGSSIPAIGYCAPTSGPEQPLGPATIQAWWVEGEAVERLQSAADHAEIRHLALRSVVRAAGRARVDDELAERPRRVPLRGGRSRGRRLALVRHPGQRDRGRGTGHDAVARQARPQPRLRAAAGLADTVLVSHRAAHRWPAIAVATVALSVLVTACFSAPQGSPSGRPAPTTAPTSPPVVRACRFGGLGNPRHRRSELGPGNRRGASRGRLRRGLGRADRTERTGHGRPPGSLRRAGDRRRRLPRRRQAGRRRVCRRARRVDRARLDVG